MEAKWTIRHPIPPDVTGIARVHTTGWREAYGTLLPERFYGPEALTRRTNQWSRLLDDADYVARTFVAECDGEIVGFANRGPARDDDSPVPDELTSIYTLSTVYGTGIGQALLDAVLADTPAMLWVARDNPRARRFYEKNGFVPDGTEKSDSGYDGLAEIRMVRR